MTYLICSEDLALIASCRRHVKDQTGLDLGPITQWVRFCEVNYSRPASSDGDYTEKTVIYLANLAQCPPQPVLPKAVAPKTEVEKEGAKAEGEAAPGADSEVKTEATAAAMEEDAPKAEEQAKEEEEKEKVRWRG